MDIRHLTEQDAELYQQLRLEALEREPQAFTESVAEHKAVALETIKYRLRSRSSGDNFVLGAFDGGHLVGMAGFFRRQGPKIDHRGEIWGVYVANEWRAKGIGRALLEDLIFRLRSLPGLEQVALGVSSTNSAAKRLYESLGFQTYGLEVRALKIDGTYIDEELMVLYLPGGPEIRKR